MPAREARAQPGPLSSHLTLRGGAPSPGGSGHRLEMSLCGEFPLRRMASGSGRVGSRPSEEFAVACHNGEPCPLHPPGGAQQAISRWAPLLGSRPSRHPVPVEISDPTPSSQMVREEAARQMWMAPPRTSEVRGAPWSAAHLLSQPGSAPYRVQMSGGCAPTLEANAWPRAAVIWQQR